MRLHDPGTSRPPGDRTSHGAQPPARTGTTRDPQEERSGLAPNVGSGRGAGGSSGLADAEEGSIVRPLVVEFHQEWLDPDVDRLEAAGGLSKTSPRVHFRTVDPVIPDLLVAPAARPRPVPDARPSLHANRNAIRCRSTDTSSLASAGKRVPCHPQFAPVALVATCNHTFASAPDTPAHPFVPAVLFAL